MFSSLILACWLPSGHARRMLERDVASSQPWTTALRPLNAGHFSRPSTTTRAPILSAQRWSASASEPDAEFMASPLVVEAEADQRWALSIGALVVVEGLEKCPAFNGRSAVVQGWDEATSRSNILLACPEGSQQAKIKEENMRVVLPCPL